MQPKLKNTPQQAEEKGVIPLTQQLVRVPSVTAVDAKDRPASKTCLAILAEAAEKSGASVTHLPFEGGHAKWGYAVDNIYIEWVFGRGEKHLCYLGHLDVVPPGKAEDWQGNPFSGEIRDGYLYGRGTTDMKGSVAAFFSAVEESLNELKKQNLRLGMIVTMDEEWAAVNGTRKVLEWMKAEGKNPDAFIVGEPSSQDILGTHIKIGRRGSLCGTLNIKGVQGHAAYPGLFENPNRALALALAILNAHKWEDGNENFPNTNFEPIALQSGNFAQSAVIPGMAQILWNIRFTPKHTPESLEKWVGDTLAQPPAWAASHPDFAALKSISVIANKDTASKPYCSTPGKLADAAQSAVSSVLGLATKMDGSGGTTDGRFAAEIFPDAEIIELGLPERGGMANGAKPADYLAKGGMHQIDERATVSDLIHLCEIFKGTVLNYAHS